MEKNSNKIFFGVILLIIAAVLILKGINPGIMGNLFGQMSGWDVMWTFLFLAALITGIRKQSLFPIVFSIAGLVYIYQGKYMIPEIPAWAIFPPAVLIFIGLEALIPRRWHVFRTDENGEHRINVVYGRHRGEDDECENAKVLNEEGYNVELEFGSTVRYFDGDDFKNSDLECSFGSIRAYYDKATMQDSIAYIDAECNFGSIEIYIPKAWKSEIRRDHAFGRVREFGTHDWDGEHTVCIKAEANFGEIRIYHV